MATATYECTLTVHPRFDDAIARTERVLDRIEVLVRTASTSEIRGLLIENVERLRDLLGASLETVEGVVDPPRIAHGASGAGH